jgi:hypothetical protein
MDFIERIFGVSPDGGDGSLELLCVAIIVVAVAVAVYTLYRRRICKNLSFVNRSYKIGFLNPSRRRIVSIC